MKKSILTFLAAALLCGFVAAQNAADPNRARFVQVVNQFEQDPLNRQNIPDFQWALQWFKDTQDITLFFCGDEVSRFLKEKKDPASLVVLFGMESGRFEFEHPEQAKDAVAVNVASAEAVLKAYDKLLAANPKAHMKTLDHWMELQQQGKLREALAKGCK
jgi:hypothetical protein